MTLLSGVKSSVRRELQIARKLLFIFVTLPSGVKSNVHKELNPSRKLCPTRVTLLSGVRSKKWSSSSGVYTHTTKVSQKKNSHIPCAPTGIEPIISAGCAAGRSGGVEGRGWR